MSERPLQPLGLTGSARKRNSAPVKRWIVVREGNWEWAQIVTGATPEEAAVRSGGSVYHLRLGINVEVFELGDSHGCFLCRYAHPDRPFNQRDEVVTERVEAGGPERG